MTKESPVANYEMIGRLFIVFGVVCKTAGEMFELEKAARRTLLDLMRGDYERHIAIFEAQRSALKRLLGRVPLFRDRDYQEYPQVVVEDILSVKEEFLALEQLPFCGNGKAKKVLFDATAFAYKMFDMIFLGLDGILKLMHSMQKHQQMLPNNPDMRDQRWQWMLDDYREKMWEDDKQLLLERLESHIKQHGRDKDSLTTLRNRIDEEGTNRLFGGVVATLNWHYLHEEDHVTYVFDHRDQLTKEQMTQHLKFIHIHQLLEQEIELCDLRLPALGAYADLFTCRAAQEMATLLAPIIARNVDFRHHYQYAAWAKAMMDMGLIYADRRNGTAMVRFINEAFGEQIDKSTILRYLNKDDFKKFKDPYRNILSVIHQALLLPSERLTRLRKAL